MKTTEYISCKILKYQNPSSGIQRRDAIKDYTPQVPFNKMKWINTPIQQPVLSQDNRSKWQHEQASKQADKGYNEYMEAKKTEQGLDRLNQFATFTDYAGLATGIGGLLGKGVKYAGKQAVKQLSKRANNEVSKATSIGDLLKSRGFGESDNFKLPDYATPNSPSDPVDLHALRLSNRGFDKLPKTVNGQTHFNSRSFSWPYKSESMATNLHAYDVDPTKWIDNLSTDFSKASRGAVSPKDLHSWALDRANNETLFATSGTNNIYVGHKGITKTAKEFGEKNINKLISHEMDHAIHIPGEPPKGFDLDYLIKSTPKQPNYFPTKNSTELAARGSQLKDYFGLTSPDQELTEDMLRYAAKNYVKDTGTDNNMTTFFNSITDWKEAAKWLSEWSSAVAVPVIITNKK